ncbi:MAG: tetratricopeptide repeat protein [Candidatus Hydrogenedentes bacterium]|nr:tetratricopeptide repeat protein [Candidatus Hydrogenedentota bacterium]
MSKKKQTQKRGQESREERVAHRAAEQREHKTALFVGMVLASITFIAYSRVLYNGFVHYDDELYVTENAAVQAGLTLESLYYALTGVCAANWHPLTMLSHIVDCTLYGLAPIGHHLSSLLLHSANTFLLFLILRRATGAFWPSAAVALLFGVHPLHVVSVAHVAQRKDVLSTFFWMLTMLAYARYAGTRSRIAYALSLAFYALGLLAKPMLVTLPIVLLLLDYWPLGRFTANPKRGVHYLREAWQLCREKLPFLALAILVSIVTLLVQQASGTVATLDRRPLLLRIENSLVSYVLYLLKMIWPSGLSPFYPYPELIPVWKVLGAVAVLAALTALALVNHKRHPYFIVGWLWYLITLLPVIGIIQVGAQALADRYTYVPLIGIFIALVWGIDRALQTKPQWRGPVLAGSAAVFAAFMCVSWVYAGVWRTPRTLWEHAIAVTEDNLPGYCHLGVSLAEEGDLEGAERYLKEALRIMPGFGEAQHNLGVVYAMYADRYIAQGRLDDAIDKYAQAAAMDPEDPDFPMALGQTYWRKRDYPNAAGAFAEAVKIAPKRVDARFNLATAHEAAGQYDSALRELDEVERLQPGNELTKRARERVLRKQSGARAEAPALPDASSPAP